MQVESTNFSNKKIGILGFGIEGRATAEFLVKNGARDAVVLDSIQKIDKPKNLNLNYQTGKDYLKNLANFDEIFVTPGIKPNLPEIINAKKNGVKFRSQIELFFNLCPCPIVGVTGTKGKGTTSTLIYEILKVDKKNVFLAGNIGIPAISLLPKLKKSSIVVLELSSFQLQYITKSPHIAVVLKITQDHLDYHKSIAEYVNAKKQIVRSQTKQDYAVLNYDSKESRSFKKFTKAKVFYASNQSKVSGCFATNKEIILNTKNNTQILGKTDNVKLKGRHNLENITAASMASYLAGAKIATISKTIKDFKGLEHRLEFVGKFGDVEFYNDSFSTTPDAAIAALNSFEAGKIILIAGGSKKGVIYENLGKKIAERAKTTILIGETANEIKNEVEKNRNNTKTILGLSKMEEIIKTAIKESSPGDYVILSPACASFGLFKNYKDRGEQFKHWVKTLAKNN